ncbi:MULTISPECIES: ABC transporter ATP-binding protein [unclassified Rothia (in: high G+C Gram-positive bacteria)]|uniref:ABC transporter ATP-binding protein n=1 Tax=unclassified Rothia (in: high G+C Gram-positive bacteria) TaxID=2689056 RepID=UPI00195CA6A1|nr:MULTISPECIES: ABC transporter ATP-binding protein [unclassified Rothia (in: high G+C Gram-positive bacteria)]MBM7051463.1 ABC transporter ATP-binding protein [Rothia sp. ZJ1223]QRZ61252.1 ABC transporter ATP-binding protein [Rothia sp. ZJ932]
MKLELREVTKKFGDFTANDSIDLVVRPGTVHCLLGENGAGKSTLMNVIYGLYRPTSGQILIDDQPVTFKGPGDAMAAGIGMVHQHFMLVPVFTVAENIALGAESTNGVTLNLEETRVKIREISDRYGFNVDPDAIVENLPVGVQQRVEIIKALVRDAEILILDEPTAVLTPAETDQLLEIMDQLRRDGKSLLFISHKLREVRQVSDDITVIRRGKVVGTADPSASTNELASLMVGKAVQLTVDKDEPKLNNNIFEVSNLTLIADNGVPLLKNVSFEVRGGEILAVAGVQGNGQTELAESIIGLHSKATGSLKLNGQELLGKTTKQVLHSGVGFVPEDRSKDGLVGSFSIAENLILDLFDTSDYSSAGTLKRSAVSSNAARAGSEFDIRMGSTADAASTLSGGNQQKIVVARELSRDLELFVASQPTRGVDVGSIEFIHKRIVAERDKGVPVMIVSTELDEVYALADRIAVFFHGELMGIAPKDTPRSVLGQMMAGASYEEAKASQQEATGSLPETDSVPPVAQQTTQVPWAENTPSTSEGERA